MCWSSWQRNERRRVRAEVFNCGLQVPQFLPEGHLIAIQILGIVDVMRGSLDEQQNYILFKLAKQLL